jgi:hypothetical protein
MPYERESKPGSIPPHYIEIRQSTIPGANEGAFAACDIPAGVVIGEYLGKIYKGKEMDKATGDYLFSVSRDGQVYKLIDGKLKKYSSWVRYVNCPQSQSGGNAHFFQYDERIFLKTDKVIPKGQEIFSYYGKEYVDNQLRQYFTTENKPKISVKKTGVKCRSPSPKRSPKRAVKRV